MKKLICLLLCLGLISPLCGVKVAVGAAAAGIAQETAIRGCEDDDIVTVVVETNLPCAAEGGGAADYGEIKKAFKKAVPEAIFKYEYDLIFSGFSARIRYGSIGAAEAVRGVEKVHLAASYEAAETNTLSGEEMTEQGILLDQNGMYKTDMLGYHGAGMLIGVIDSGINVDHEAFSVSPPDPKIKDSDCFTELIPSLKARDIMAFLKPSMIFKSDKVAFAFDYADADTDPKPLVSGDHGIHVAGIAAGNNGAGFKGSAYDAQLAMFKVFGNGISGASDEDCLAAMEDAITIGCDVVNMSLGKPVGWVTGSVLEEEIFDRAADLGVTMLVAAGNDGKSVNDSALCPDSGTVGSMSTDTGAISVGNFDSEGFPSDSSSWGCANDLSLKPEVVGNGTSVYSATMLNDKSYGYKSGTSMATPNAAGAAAVLKQSLGETFTGRELDLYVKNALMSTASVMYNGKGIPYSPRLQGAGFVNLTSAVGADAILAVDGAEGAKAELGDDEDKTGVYGFAFKVINLSNAEVEYHLDCDVLTEEYSAAQKLYFKPRELDAEVAFSTQGKRVTALKVAPRAEVEVQVEITLSEMSKAYLENFPNGMFVEGFVYLGGGRFTELSLPYLGFYGDWSAAPVFDKLINDGEAGLLGNTVLYGGTSQEVFALGCVSTGATSARPADYIAVPLSAYDEDFTIVKLHTYILRSILKYEIKVTDYDTGEEIFVKTGGEIKKIFSKVTPTELSVGFTPADYLDADTMTNNSRYTLEIYGYLDDGDDAADDVMKIPFFIDCENPVIESYSTIATTNSVYLRFSAFDNQYLQAYRLYYLQNGEYVSGGSYTLINGGRGRTVTVSADITKLTDKANGEVYVKLTDYAGNSVFIGCALNGGAAETPPVNKTYTGDAGDKFYADTFTEDGMLYARHKDGVYTLLRGRNGNIAVKEGTVRIAAYAFKGCKVGEVTLPASLARVGEGAFVGGADKIMFEGDAPALEYGATPYGYNNFGASKVMVRHTIADGFENRVYDSVFTDAKYPTYILVVTDIDGTELYRAEVGEGEEPILPVFDKAGYINEGIFTNAECAEKYIGGPIYADTELTVKFTRKKYTVTFEGLMGDAESAEIVSGGVVRRPDDPVREGYVFKGWYAGDTLYDFETPVNGDVVLTALWEQAPPAGCACGTFGIGFMGPSALLGLVFILPKRRRRLIRG